MPIEYFRVLLFVILVGAVYATAIAALWQSRRGQRLSAWQKSVLGVAGIGLLCIAYGYWIEPYWPQITRTAIPSAKISKPIRLVLLSDIHSDPKVRLEDRLPSLIASLKPDAILFAGDSVNSPEGLPNFKRLMTALARVAPTFAARGNWDAFWPELDFFGGTGVRDLQGEAVKQVIGGTTLWVAGLDVRYEPHLKRQKRSRRMLSTIPEEALTIFLHHYPYPDVLLPEDRSKIDLFAAGHVHGGQVSLPIYGALITFSRFGKRYERGFYEYPGEMKMYVSRGIGMEGGRAPRVRFWSRPEIAVIDFIPKK